MIALAACVAALLGVSAPEHMPMVEYRPQAYLQALARASRSPTAHLPGGKVLGGYFHRSALWPHGKVMIAEGWEGDRPLMAHELAHHVMYHAGGDWRNEQHATWVQDLVKRGACDG